MSADREAFEALVDALIGGAHDPLTVGMEKRARVLAAFDALLQRCEAAEKDAARYRHIRMHLLDVYDAQVVVCSPRKFPGFPVSKAKGTLGEAFDKAIDQDAAMRATDTKGGA